MLPNQGRCLAVFLLASAATLKPRSTIQDWVGAAQETSSIVAASLDLKQPAEGLLASGLAHQRGTIEISHDLANLCTMADRVTLISIARLLFLKFPPPWLRVAVGEGGVCYDYVPATALDELEWLHPDLTDLLLDVYQKIEVVRDGQVKKWLGDTAELIVMAALRLSGRNPIQVSKISDAFGYDIECQNPRERIEVKAASEGTKGTFHLSRNEFEKSKMYGAQWRLLQVVFCTEAFVSPHIRSAHVMELLEVSSAAIGQAIPPDTLSFKWSASAEVCPPSELWSIVDLPLDKGFVSSRRP